ncbi:MAG: indole-3-glycerol phosphate synthase TrpC [Pseudomonadales bacterium]|nr:indole-3-glycerol phosphate synthase TrpC [Pseudomonadales bacterium]
MVADVLKKIVAKKQLEVALRKERLPLDRLKGQVYLADPVRHFKKALLKKVEHNQAAVIAEIKKASPSKGVIRENFDVVSIALSYQEAGASCLSVLTDVSFFQGSDDYLVAARAAVKLPVLRKDFTIDEYQIYEARSLGADCILLIVSILTDQQLSAFHSLAKALSMDVLVEVHDEKELIRALTIGPDILGINNRNLRTFEVSLDTTIILNKLIEEEVLVITESGINSSEDVRKMLDEGIYGFLVGETFMRENDPGEKLLSLFSLSEASR